MSTRGGWKPTWKSETTEGRVGDWLDMAEAFELLTDTGKFDGKPLELLQSVMMLYASAGHLFREIKDKQEENK